jgi:hypothetical protein
VKPVVALLACVLIIGACGDDDDTPKAADPARDASFVAAMHAQGLTYGEAAMVNVAHVFCDDVDNAHDVESFVAGAAGTGIATKDPGRSDARLGHDLLPRGPGRPRRVHRHALTASTSTPTGPTQVAHRSRSTGHPR